MHEIPVSCGNDISPFALDYLANFYYVLSVVSRVEKSLEYFRKLPNSPPVPPTTLDILIDLAGMFKSLDDTFLVSYSPALVGGEGKVLFVDLLSECKGFLHDYTMPMSVGEGVECSWMA